MVGKGKCRNNGFQGSLTNCVSNAGADRKVRGMFYKAVAQAVLLFGTDMWVLTPMM